MFRKRVGEHLSGSSLYSWLHLLVCPSGNQFSGPLLPTRNIDCCTAAVLRLRLSAELEGVAGTKRRQRAHGRAVRPFPAFSKNAGQPACQDLLKKVMAMHLKKVELLRSRMDANTQQWLRFHLPGVARHVP